MSESLRNLLILAAAAATGLALLYAQLWWRRRGAESTDLPPTTDGEPSTTPIGESPYDPATMLQRTLGFALLGVGLLLLLVIATAIPEIAKSPTARNGSITALIVFSAAVLGGFFYARRDTNREAP